MRDFKSGDRVQVKKDAAYSANVQAGDIGTVVGDDGDLLVKMDEPRGETLSGFGVVDFDWYFRPEDLEYVLNANEESASELVAGLEPLKVLAEAAREHNVFISLTFSPSDPEPDDDSS